MKSPRKERNHKLKMAVQKLLNQGNVSTQKDICDVLNSEGLEVNQSTISRVLRQIGAVKTKNARNEVVYCLPKESAPPSTHSPLSNLVIDIQKNEHMIVIHTSPGSAALIGRILDHNIEKLNVMGILSGDDTIFVTTYSVNDLDDASYRISSILKSI